MLCPKFVPPNSLPTFVELGGGGGRSICDCVGARDWRMEYVRCIFLKVGLELEFRGEREKL